MKDRNIVKVFEELECLYMYEEIIDISHSKP